MSQNRKSSMRPLPSTRTIAVQIVTGWYEEASRNEQFPFTILQPYQIELVNRITAALDDMSIENQAKAALESGDDQRVLHLSADLTRAYSDLQLVKSRIIEELVK